MKKNEVTLDKVYDLITEFREEVRDTYVTRGEFFPVQSLTYGLASLILVGVGMALISQVVKAFP